MITCKKMFSHCLRIYLIYVRLQCSCSGFKPRTSSFGWLNAGDDHWIFEIWYLCHSDMAIPTWGKWSKMIHCGKMGDTWDIPRELYPNQWDNFFTWGKSMGKDGKCIKHMIFGSIWDITVGDIQWPFQPGIEISMEPWSNMIVWDTLSSDHRIPQGTGIETGHLGKSWRKQGAFQWRHGPVQSSCVAEVQRWLTAPSKRAVHSRTSRCYNFPGVWLES